MTKVKTRSVKSNQAFISAEPIVKLEKTFTNPFHNAIATARTCYSSKGIISDDQITPQNYPLAQSIYQAGHHTVLGHAHFQFSLANISRQFIWSFLHNHPHYNSEQVSQRYVGVKANTMAIPPLQGEALTIYRNTVEFQMAAYNRLTEVLLPVVESEYLKIFPHHNTLDKKIKAKLQKRALEVARYVLPVATFAYMYHTISGITLLRYYRLCQQYDTPLEQRIVVGRMVEELLHYDPLYETILEPPLDLMETPEARFFTTRPEWSDAKHRSNFLKEFDESLGSYTSKLIDYKINNERSLADAVREVLGVPRTALDDTEAIELALNPAGNQLLGESLNLTMMSKLGRTLHHPSYTFRKRLSHTADSQDQRHRTTPASRPILLAHLVDEPDYITPALVSIDEGVQRIFDQTMAESWQAISKLRQLGVEDEFVAYLLPNAATVRFSESADLLGLHHKHRMRLCYLAQEEIWRASVEEAQQIRAINPRLGKYLLPPCTQRHLAAKRPTCPEGDRFCGVKVWQLDIDHYQRAI
ncbi:MAG: FAD-dependent thymidylate synthase [Acidobacteriota bacterium]